MEALQLNVGHRDSLVVQEGRTPRRRSLRPCKSSLHSRKQREKAVCMPIAFHVLCVLTCVRRSAGARRPVNTVSRLSRACCLLCLCDAYCCGCCDASSGDACACSSTDGDCDVAPAGSGQACERPIPSSSATRQRKEETKRKEGEYVCAFVCICMHFLFFLFT